MDIVQPEGFEFIEGLAKEIATNSLIFPTSLNVTMRIRTALNDPNSSADKVAYIVGAEPVLSAQLLRLANSAALRASGRQITDLHTAVKQLGFSLVRNIAISVGMRQLSQAQDGMPPQVEKLWAHSILVAATSYVLARKLTRLNPDEAMLAGLLHDIGKFYLLTRIRNHPDILADEAAIEEIISPWHAEISEMILESWEVPEGIEIAVRDHELFERIHYGGQPNLTDIVMTANILASQNKPGSPEGIDWSTAPSAFTRLKLNAETCAAVMLESEEEIRNIAQALG